LAESETLDNQSSLFLLLKLLNLVHDVFREVENVRIRQHFLVQTDLLQEDKLGGYLSWLFPEQSNQSFHSSFDSSFWAELE